MVILKGNKVITELEATNPHSRTTAQRQPVCCKPGSKERASWKNRWNPNKACHSVNRTVLVLLNLNHCPKVVDQMLVNIRRNKWSIQRNSRLSFQHFWSLKHLKKYQSKGQNTEASCTLSIWDRLSFWRIYLVVK